MTEYFVRAIHGMEYIAQLELLSLPQLTVKSVGYRRIHFEYAHKPHRLLGVRSVDDVFVYLGHIDGMTRHRSTLPGLRQAAAAVAWDDGLMLCQDVRFIPENPRFSVTPTLAGNRNYRSSEVSQIFEQAISEKYGWEPATFDTAQLDIRILIEDDRCIFGMRLSEEPLHRRAYKQETLPGSLKAPVAAGLLLLANPQPNSRVYDPFGGAGTIPIEAALGWKDVRSFCSDNNLEALQIARRNAGRAQVNLAAIAADAMQLPLQAHSVQHVVSDLPWGRQTETQLPLESAYRQFLQQLQTLLTPDGTAVLLTEHAGLLLNILKSDTDLHAGLARRISLFGSHPTIVMIGGQSIQRQIIHRQKAQAGWRALVQDCLNDARTHPHEEVGALMTALNDYV